MGIRNILRQKKRSSIVFSAAAVGMLGILFGAGFMNGMFAMFTDSAIESGMGHIQIRPEGYLKSRKTGMVLQREVEIQSHLEKLKKKSPHFHYAFRMEREGLVRMGSHSVGVVIYGVDPEMEKGISRFDEWLIRGEYLKSQGVEMTILMGKVNADKMELDTGDYVILSLANALGDPVSVRARISGIFQSIAEPIDKYMVLVNRDQLSRIYLGKSGIKSSGYATILAHSLEDVRPWKKLFQAELLAAGSTGGKVEIADYADLEPGIARMIEISRSSMMIFYVILLSGFSLTLMNTILMSVMERTREIGMMMAMGARGTIIFLQIVTESVLLSALGSLAGILLGVIVILVLSGPGISLAAFAKGMEMMGKSGTLIYPSLAWFDIISSFSIAMIMSIAASVYPAWKAVRMLPVKAIYDR